MLRKLVSYKIKCKTLILSLILKCISDREIRKLKTKSLLINMGKDSRKANEGKENDDNDE